MKRTAERRFKACSICGKRFGCEHDESGCWCEAVVVTRRKLAEIRAIADDCICQACLASFGRSEPTGAFVRMTRENGSLCPRGG
jgi:hypothetical protein